MANGLFNFGDRSIYDNTGAYDTMQPTQTMQPPQAGLLSPKGGQGAVSGIGERGKGILGSLFGAIGNAVRRPDFGDRLVLATGGLQMFPNEQAMAMARENINRRRAEEQQMMQANSIAEQFKSMGRPELAQFISANPQYAPEFLAQYMQQQYFPEPQETFSIVPHEEILALGLDPNRTYQRSNVDRRITQIGDSPLVNISNGEEIKPSSEAQTLIDTMNENRENAQNAYNLNIQLVELAEGLKNNTDIIGAGADTMQKMKYGLSFVQRFFNLEDDIDLSQQIQDLEDMQAASALIEDILFQKVQALGGARGITDVEFRRLLMTVPQLTNNPRAFGRRLESIINQNNRTINQWQNARTDVRAYEQKIYGEDYVPFVSPSFDMYQPFEFDINEYFPARPPEASGPNVSTLDVPFETITPSGLRVIIDPNALER